MVNEAIVKKIYKNIPEEESKEIYENRLLYSMTGDVSFIQKIISRTPEGRTLFSKLDEYSEFVLFGCGIWGRNILEVYQNYNWKYAFDNSPKKDFLTNRNQKEHLIEIPVKKYMKQNIDGKTAIVISSRLYHKEIEEQLLSDGVKKEQIINAGKLIDEMSKRQYFDLPYMKKNDKEIFVDAGSFDGETSVEFSKRYASKYKEIIALEPDKSNLEKLKSKIATHNIHDINLIPVGLWNEKKSLSFKSIGNGSSMVDEEGLQTIDVDRLDDLLPQEKEISFIKMDLEGSEYNALLGCERIIKKNHPKLAISLYHKPEDVWELPNLILEFDSSYQFYLRHYSIAASETVLYGL